MSKEMLDVLFGHSFDAVIYKNSDFEYVFSNIQSMKFSNFLKTDNVLNKTVFDIMPQNIAEIVSKNDLEALKTLQPVVYELEFDKNNVFEMVTNPVVLDNSFVGLITIGRDITEKVKLETQKDVFVATLTHDLKTPTLAQIRTIELLFAGAFGPLGEVQKEMLGQVLNSCKYMYGMISYILSTYKFENGKAKLKTQSFDFKELIKECCFELESLNIEKNLRFVTKFNIEDSVVEGDKNQLKRVLVNMISNAISYAFKDTVIEIMLEGNSKEIIFYTINQSPYIPSDVLNRIFEKYVSDPSHTKFSKTGTGLGLYLSEQIITAHKGKIIAESSMENKNKIGFKMPKAFSEVSIQVA